LPKIGVNPAAELSGDRVLGLSSLGAGVSRAGVPGLLSGVGQSDSVCHGMTSRGPKPGFGVCLWNLVLTCAPLPIPMVSGLAERAHSISSSDIVGEIGLGRLFDVAPVSWWTCIWVVLPMLVGVEHIDGGGVELDDDGGGTGRVGVFGVDWCTGRARGKNLAFCSREDLWPSICVICISSTVGL
jgi:hypothetical protein